MMLLMGMILYPGVSVLPEWVEKVAWLLKRLQVGIYLQIVIFWLLMKKGKTFFPGFT